MGLSKKNLRFFRSTNGLGGPMTDAPVDGTMPDVRGLDAEKGRVDYWCIYFTNKDLDADGFIDPFVWFESFGPLSSLTIGLDPAGKNKTAQSISSPETAPTGVSFIAARSEVPLWLPDAPYLSADYVGLWIRRVTPKGAKPSQESFVLRLRGETY